MRRLTVALLILFTLVAPFAYDAIAQSGKETAKKTGITSIVDTSQAASKLPVIKEDPPKLSAYDKVDHLFKTMVDYLEMVCFYEIGSGTQTYVVVEPHEFYIRPKDDMGPFKNLDPSNTKTITIDEAKLLSARNKLIEGKGKLFRSGTTNDKPIEYLTIKLDVAIKNKKTPYGKTYVLDNSDNKYHMLTGIRSLPSADEKEILSSEEVSELAKQGRLKLDKNKDHILTKSAGGAPIVVLWLAIGAVFFTVYMRGYNIWGFRHAIEIVRGKYDNPDEDGEVTHFQALASALSATVGLGNISGVTIAMTIGGPGAFFWMLFCGLFGMSSKFVECTLGQKYRTVKPDGTILGGPMRYLKAGLEEIGLKRLGLALSFFFTVMCILASFGGGNMYQANESGAIVLSQLQKSELEKLTSIDKQMKVAAEKNDLKELKSLQEKRTTVATNVKSFEKNFRMGYGMIMALLVGVVIIGGIKRIGAAAEKVVPTMCLMYISACTWIIAVHMTELGPLIKSIFTEAFNPQSMAGGVVGVLVVGVTRAAFSNEAGVGSASIAHSAAKTDEPVREGSVALLGPFIDTIIVCSMTALVILITDAWNNEEWVISQGLKGVSLTSKAFANEISWFPWLLTLAVVLFAYSSIISWSYYGERCWEILFGARSVIVYKALTVTFVFIGAIENLEAVLSFSDMMILVMAFPNILGAVLLAPKVKRDLTDYWKRYKAGEFKTYQ